jgi:hypothetical protein
MSGRVAHFFTLVVPDAEQLALAGYDKGTYRHIAGTQRL